MGPNQTLKLLHSKGNYQQHRGKRKKNPTKRMGENICKRCDKKEVNLKYGNSSYNSISNKQSNQKKKMGRRPEKITLQRRQRESQQAHKKMFNTANY